MAAIDILKQILAKRRPGRFLGDVAGAYTEIFLSNLYEPFGTTARKDNKDPAPNLESGRVVYRVVSRDGYYDMSVNGVSFFNTASNTFSKDNTSPFTIGQKGVTGSDFDLKYLAILDDNSTDLTADLMTRFGIS